MLIVEQLKEAAREFLEEEIKGEDFLETIDTLIRSSNDSDVGVKWLCEQILIAR